MDSKSRITSVLEIMWSLMEVSAEKYMTKNNINSNCNNKNYIIIVVVKRLKHLESLQTCQF